MIEATLLNRRDELPRIAALVDRLCAEHGVHADVRADLQVALDEALVNVITHAFADDAPHEIRVRLDVGNGRFEVVIEDDGVPFDPLAHTPAETTGAIEDRAIGGLGIRVMRGLMSEVTYARVDGRNRLTLTRRLPP